MKKIFVLVLLLLFPHLASADCNDRKDWKRAIWRVPLHFALSTPVAVSSLVVPPLGKAYVNWRVKSEKQDVLSGRDTPSKASIDLYSQVVLVKGVLKIYGIKTQDDTLPPCQFSDPSWHFRTFNSGNIGNVQY